MFSFMVENGDVNEPRLRLEAARQAQQKHGRHWNEYFIPDFDLRTRRQRWSDPTVREHAANAATSLSKDGQWVPELRTAFQKFGLDPRNPYSWRTLLEFFAIAHFEPTNKKSRGPRAQWTPHTYAILLADVARVHKANPGKRDNWVCDQLVDEERYNRFRERKSEKLRIESKTSTTGRGSSLRRILQDARNENKNPGMRIAMARHLEALRRDPAADKATEKSLKTKARRLAAMDFVLDHQNAENDIWGF